MRYTGPKNRLARREGVDLGLKTPGSKSHANLLKKISVPPGQHGAGRRVKKMSERGKQLREMQKIKHIFGITTKEMKRYFLMAVKKTGNTGLFMSQFLERRLDNVVYRLGFAPTRASARQLVAHKHFKVNDVRVGIPSTQLRVGDTVTFADEKTLKIQAVEKALANKDLFMPVWLERKAIIGKMIANPTSELIEKQIILRLVIEYFSR
jgi:small subunit ribosomal protein S4